METYTNLTLSFYKALKQDVLKLYPEFVDEISESFEWLDNLISISDENRLLAIKSLCLLGKSIEKSLITPALLEVPSYFPLHENSVLPKFLYSLLSEVFYDSGLRRYSGNVKDHHLRDDGAEIAKDAASAVFVLRQVTLAFSKAQDLPCDTEPVDELIAFRDRVTAEIPLTVRYPQDPLGMRIRATAQRLLRVVLNKHGAESFVGDPEMVAPLAQWVDNPFGRHGPGAVVGEEIGFDKWDFNPPPHMADIAVGTHDGEPLYLKYEESLTSFENVDCALVTLVPKDFRGRRIICIEPKERMFAQRGLMEVLYDLVHTNRLTSYAIDFRDQSKSQRFIQKRGISTIDLKDASDRVSLDLVKCLFPRSVTNLLLKYRSPYLLFNAAMPDKEGDWYAPHVYRYTTAFTMGNALCFPIETLVFWSLSLATMIECSSLRIREGALMFIMDQPGAWTIHTFRKHFPIRVFGDDIAVPSRFYSDVCETLREAGLSVNVNKSCCETPVRESCGAWNYAGTDVRITRFAFAQLKDTQSWISWRANADELNGNGFKFAATQVCEHLVEFHPRTVSSMSLLGHIRTTEGYRWNKDLQRVEVCLPTLREKGRRLSLPGYKGFYAHVTNQATFRTVCRGDAQGVEWQWVDLATLSS